MTSGSTIISTSPGVPRPSMLLLMATACGVIAAASYFAQALNLEIGRDLHLPGWARGFTLTAGHSTPGQERPLSTEASGGKRIFCLSKAK
jgi:hypothetical protein